MIRLFNNIPVLPDNGYPTSDGRPMAETDLHRDLMLDLIETLKHWYRDDPNVYVSGNLLLFYEKDNKRRHVSPDVFVVHGVQKAYRPNYLMWEEKTPDVVIELTSKTTRKEDSNKKWKLYEGKLQVKEYFLFDPKEEYLDPSFQGYRRVRGKFRSIDLVADRLPSELLGLHLERVGDRLRLRNPGTGERLATPSERATAGEARAAAEAARAEAQAAHARVEAARASRAEAENERLRKELEELRRTRGPR
jgi:Uma2 family endonuclease